MEILLLGGEDGDDKFSDEERVARKQGAEDNLLARYRTEWPWWDDLHALWCERPNFNLPGVQNSSQSSLQLQSSQDPVIDLDSPQLSDSDSVKTVVLPLRSHSLHLRSSHCTSGKPDFTPHI